MMRPIIYWFRNDLRLHDNPALWAAAQNGAPIVAVFVFDDLFMAPTDLGFARCGNRRKSYWQNSVLALQQQLRQMGGELFVFQGSSVEVISSLYRQIYASAVFASHEYAFEELEMERALSQQVPLTLFWGNQLFMPDVVGFTPPEAPYYYTAFKNKFWRNESSLAEVPTVKSIRFYDQIPALPSHQQFQPSIDNTIETGVGEMAALARLNDFLSPSLINNYAVNRERFDVGALSTLLSPFLANGSLSVRRVYNLVNAIESTDELVVSSRLKLNEQLIWRDYYRWLFLRYGKKIFRPTGLRTVVPKMYDDREAFQKWCAGKTGQPLVDACMNELAQTGVMNNRGRMVVSYYLSKVMCVNWLWGALWFESQLIDYDVCNNYGNWAYQCGTGTDSRINRRFNLEKQVQKFDPQHAYVQKWGFRQPTLF